MRSLWTVGVLLLLLGLHAASLNLPWYTYSHSSGRTLPPEFPSNETGENVSRRLYYPFALRGDVNATQAQEASQVTTPLGWGVVAALMTTAILVAVELFWGHREWARWPGMALTVIGLGVTVAVLLLVFFRIHPMLYDEGVRGTFTNRQIATGFVRSTLGWGWVAGGLAVLGHVAHFAFRYQQGSLDMGFVEYLRRRP